MENPEQPTRTEAAAAALLVFPATAVIASYLIDRAGFTIAPWLIFAISLGVSALVGFGLARGAPAANGHLAVFAGVVGALFAWLLWLARPHFLPLGTGPDLTHHLLLIDYIERHWHLVREANVEAFLGEMVQYTPGSHLLAALAGRWFGTNGLHAVHGVMAFLVALKAGLVFLIATRVLPASPSRTPQALLAVALLFLPQAYFLDSFIRSSFIAQVVSETFAVAMWWSLIVWDDTGSIAFMALFAMAGAVVFLTWPVWIGVPLLTLGLLMLLRRGVPFRARAVAAVVGLVPIAAIAGLYVWHRLGWIQIVRTGGGVIRPVPDQYGWWFLGLSIAGLILAIVVRRGRITAAFVASLGLESLALLVNARATHDTPYMALKMFYLAIYPQTIAAMLVVSLAWKRVQRSVPPGGMTRVLTIAAWLACAVITAKIVRPAVDRIKPHGVVSEPVYLAGQWARAHVKPSCVEYLVGDDSAAYWLHLSVLGNPRMLSRSGDDATYDPRLAIIRWLTPGGLPYAVADLPTLPRDIREDLDIVAQFDRAAVVRRRGPAVCPDFH